MDKKLTFIIPIYHPEIAVSEIFRNLYKQTNQNFDIIVSIDKPTDKELNALCRLQETYNNNLKVIINTTHQHLNSVIKQSLEYVKTEYTYVLYSYTSLKSKFVESVYEFLNQTDQSVDILSFDGNLNGLVGHRFFVENIQPKKVYNIRENLGTVKNVVPFSFAIITKTHIIKEVFNTNLVKNLNHQYSSILTYMSLTNAKTFAYLDTTWVKDENNNLMLFNAKNLSKEWTFILNNASDPEFKNVLEFARFVNFAYYFAGYLGLCKLKRKDPALKVLNNLKRILFEEASYYASNLNEIIKNNSVFKENVKVVTKLMNLFENIENWKYIYSAEYEKNK
ncbi:glycosyltransferase [[Mycoplasma] falconis]|uniref:Glycosyltransferase n=1 Tax=[Mycoplasma] falconis TaxID=92403 RepID=A0A501XBN4_9BACT|nr:glycosyltransferase [[Mycoplasma] falconis]TPE57773.1 glycosyltransferase [[Mycoplasma] falconis]